MQKHQFTHRPKSEMAYVSHNNKITIRLQALTNISNKIEVVYGDPFSWGKSTDKKTFSWDCKRCSMQKVGSTTHHDYFQVTLSRPTKRTKYAFLINDTYLFGSKYLLDISQTPKEMENLENFFNFPYILQEDRYHVPSWVKDTVWYSVFPDRFNNSDNLTHNILQWDSVKKYDNTMFFGGNLKGMTEKLDYIQSMGFSGIYLTPIFKAPSAHKYDTMDYYEVDPQFGTKDDLKRFVKAAHKRGIKVLLDAVFNHVSYHHPFFQDVQAKGQKSPYYDYFFIREYPFSQETFKTAVKNRELPPYETFAFTPRMPKLNTNNEILRNYLLDVGAYWIKEFDIDGWRLDVSNEISHDFWRAFRKHIKTIKPEAFILGENWDNSAPWLEGDQHDSVMNYEFTFPLWQFYQKDENTHYDASLLRDAIIETMMSYPENVLSNLFNLLDSHDTKRIVSRLNSDEALIKQIYLFMFLLPGSPSIFYGGEIGMKGGEDPDNRRCMIWDESRHNKSLQSFIQTLIKLYNNDSDFRNSQFDVLYAYQDTIVIRKGQLIGCFNRGEATITLPESLKIKGFDYLSETNNEQTITTLSSKAFYLIKTKE